MNIIRSTMKKIQQCTETKDHRNRTRLDAFTKNIHLYQNDTITFDQLEQEFVNLIESDLSSSHELILFRHILSDKIENFPLDKQESLLSLLAYGAVSNHKNTQTTVLETVWNYMPMLVKELGNDETVFSKLDRNEARSDLMMMPGIKRHTTVESLRDMSKAQEMFKAKLTKLKGPVSGMKYRSDETAYSNPSEASTLLDVFTRSNVLK